MMQVVAEVSRAFVSDNSFSGNLTRLTMLLVFTVIFRALLSGGIFGRNSTHTHLSLLQVLAGVANASVNDKSFGGNLARVCPL